MKFPAAPWHSAREDLNRENRVLCVPMRSGHERGSQLPAHYRTQPGRGFMWDTDTLVSTHVETRYQMSM